MEARRVDSSGSGLVPVEGSHKYGNELNLFHIFRELDSYWQKGNVISIEDCAGP